MNSEGYKNKHKLPKKQYASTYVVTDRYTTSTTTENTPHGVFSFMVVYSALIELSWRHLAIAA